MCAVLSGSVMSNSLRPHGLYPPAFFVHAISQAKMLEWVAIFFPREFPNPGIKPASPAWQADLFYHWATWEAS